MELEKKRKQKNLVVAIDPGFENCGVVIGEITDTWLFVTLAEVVQIHDWKDTNPLNLIKSLENFYNWLCGKLDNGSNVTFVIEQQYWSPKFAAVGLRLRTFQTALLTLLVCKGFTPVLLASSTVKQSFGIHTKNRAQNKVEMKRILKEQFSISESNEHLADCFLLLLYYCKNKAI